MSTFVQRIVLGLVGCSCTGDNAESDTDQTPSDTDTAVTPPDTDTDTLPDPEATLVQGAPTLCAPIGRTGDDWFERRAIPVAPDSDAQLPLEPWVWGSGLVVADFDDDGLVDVFTSNELVPSFYRNAGNTLTDVSEAVFSGIDVELSSGGSAADYDGDGDLDLLITRYMRSNLLMRNDGAGAFTDVTALVNLPTEPRRSMSSAWADYDLDGDLDLYVGNYGFVDDTVPSEQFLPGDADWFLRNEGGATFTDLSSLIPQPVHDGFAYAVGWIDLDDNGFPDLYTVNDFGVAYPNQVLWNEDGVLTLDAGNDAGLNGGWTGMGLDFADINNDGIPDLFMPIWNGLVLLEGTTTGLWVESGAARTLSNDLGGRGQKVAWGGDFGDVDNDGDEDLLVQFGWVDVGSGKLFENPLNQPDALYLMDATGSYEDRGVPLGVDDHGIGRGGVFADFNNDGFLDIVKRDVRDGNIAYLSKCDANAWVRVHLHGASGDGNTKAIGAKVRATAGGKVQTAWVRAGGLSLGSSGPPEVHFGFGAVDVLDRLEVTWPDGRVSVFADVPTRANLDITQLPAVP